LKPSINKDFRTRLHEIIYEADTPAGKLFDLSLLVVILISIVALMLESVESIRIRYGFELGVLEWVITIFFTVEYIARLIAVRTPSKFIFSFTGISDLLATLPGYVDLLFPGLHFLIALRAIRLLRIFRILKLVHFVGASDMLVLALKKSRIKIAVFLFTVIVICIILGTVMYMVEGPENGFTNIPVSIYWTIVTLTTVGFGDITPQTPFGQLISMAIMILGYGIIAVPTGIVTSEIVSNKRVNTQSCPNCSADHHSDHARYCYNCGYKLNS
jgi:voltage-gated potassium channel